MILFLTAYMKRGFGVSVVIDNLCRQYALMGVEVMVGCMESDDSFEHSKIVILEPDVKAVHSIASKYSCRVIVAHATPFFELLPALSANYEVWCWEHGDPNPEFFIWDRRERQNIIDNKQRQVYPSVDGVIAISEFVKAEIDFPSAVVIYNGCDHIEKDDRKLSAISGPVRVGTLVRLGPGETIYKGRPILTQLQKKLLDLDAPMELHIMGRGTEQDRESLEKMGVKVHLNATDEERLEYLKNLDIFITTSLWEGFNLPLVEAQASGTVSIAFDVGAHPETTPFVTRGLDDMVSLILHYCRNPELLRTQSMNCERWVRDRFSWRNTAEISSKLLLNARST